MSSNPRGPTGSVRGVPKDQADEVIVGTVQACAKAEAPEDGEPGGPIVITREAITAVLRGHYGIEEEKLEGFIQAVEAIPGILPLGGARYLLPDQPTVWAENRGWRFSFGRLDLAQATDLLSALTSVQGTPSGTPQSLTGQVKRLEKAVLAIFPEFYR